MILGVALTTTTGVPLWTLPLQPGVDIELLLEICLAPPPISSSTDLTSSNQNDAASNIKIEKSEKDIHMEKTERKGEWGWPSALTQDHFMLRCVAGSEGQQYNHMTLTLQMCEMLSIV